MKDKCFAGRCTARNSDAGPNPAVTLPWVQTGSQDPWPRDRKAVPKPL
jgi:hypothetical protein